MRRSGTMVWTGIAATLALAAAGCGSDPQTEPTGQLALAMAPSKSGDDQTQTAGQLLGSPLRVLVTRDEVPAAGATVWWTTQNGGSLGDPTTVADDNGIASNDWTLGDGVGAQTAEASIEGAEGSPITFTAHAILGGAGAGVAGARRRSSRSVAHRSTSSARPPSPSQSGRPSPGAGPPGPSGHNVTPDNGTIPAGEETPVQRPA